MLPSNFFDLALDIGLEVFVFRDQMAVDVEKENDFAELVYLKVLFFYTWLQKRNRIYSTSLLISMSRISFTWASNQVGYIYIYTVAFWLTKCQRVLDTIYIEQILWFLPQKGCHYSLFHPRGIIRWLTNFEK